METVPELYFSKYLVTNKRYRKFIAYLEGNERPLEGSLPLKVFSGKLLKLAGEEILACPECHSVKPTFRV